MLYLNRDVKQGGRQAPHPVYYGKAGDEVRIISAHLRLPAIICEHVPPRECGAFPASICAVSWRGVESEVVLAPVAEVVKRAPSQLKARTSTKKIIITNQIEMF